MIVEDVVSSYVIHSVVPVALLLRSEFRHVRMVHYQLTAVRIAHLIVVGSLILRVRHERVACRIVEHHDVVELNLAQAFCAAIVPLRPFDVRLAAEHGQRVLCERHGEGRLRYARTIAYLAHEEVVAG